MRIAAKLVIAVLAMAFFSMLMTPATRAFFVASRKRAEMDVMSISAAVDIYMVEFGRAPESLEVLVTADENGRTLIKGRTSVPRDPWNNVYGYEQPRAEHGYRVFTLSRDGKPGGDGADTDIDNFTIAQQR